jgi:hypothetical protein
MIHKETYFLNTHGKRDISLNDNIGSLRAKKSVLVDTALFIVLYFQILKKIDYE